MPTQTCLASIPLALSVLHTVLAACAAFLGLYWLTVLYHIVRTRLTIPPISTRTPTPDNTSDAPSVCAVIPAHNEASSIATIARSLRAQTYPSFRVVFALDRCTDDTRAVLEDALAGDDRFEIIQIDACPDDWAGKVHAIHTGVSRSTAAQSADVLAFIDADTSLAPACIAACVDRLRSQRLAMLSLLSSLTTTHWFERLLQPSATFELVRQYPLKRANDRSTRRRAFANGQFIMITATAYQTLGTHAAVKDALLEDIQIARACKHHNLPAGLFPAGDALTCSMYDSYPAFVKGWKRIYTESANHKPSRLRTVARRNAAVGTALPIAAAASLTLSLTIPALPLSTLTAAIAAASLLAFFTAIATYAALARAPLTTALLYPLGCLGISRILYLAAHDLDTGTPTKWAGRTYARPTR